MPECLRSVIQILDHGQKSNSYKFALLRAFADGGEQGLASSTISFDWLAERFVSYYWPLTVTFRVRLATDPTRDPVIMRFIRQEMTELEFSSKTRFQDYKQHHGIRYRKLLSRCCSSGGCFDEVIPRFHKLRAGNKVSAILYRDSGDKLNLEEGVIEFLSTFHRTLKLLAIGGWVQFTEQFTFAPRLYEKITGVAPGRKHLRYRNFLWKVQGPNCFYCGSSSDEQLHVDHVIPWTFVLEDRVWNLVLACPLCNSFKSDRTPDDTSVSELHARNRRIIHDLQAGKFAAEMDTVSRDLREFTPESLEAHIATLVSNCRVEGFGVWQRRSPGYGS